MAREKRKMEKEEREVFRVTFTGENVHSNTQEAFTLFEKSRFGEKKDEKIYYTYAEALYLLEKKQVEIRKNGQKMSFQGLLKKLKKIDRKIETKYSVFRDMRNRGYVVKTALKFGAEFRVYPRGVHPGEDHAKWVLYPVKEQETLTWHDFAAKNRVAHSTKKNLLIAIVDEENDVTYYEVEWQRP